MRSFFRREWPVALAFLFVGVLAWYLVYTERIVQALRSDAAVHSELYAEVLRGLSDPSELAGMRALLKMQSHILDTGVPMVWTGEGGAVIAAENLPFEADLTTRDGQARVRDYVRRLDARNPPIGTPGIYELHFGDPPMLRRVRWVPWLQAVALLSILGAGAWMIRSHLRLERERSWALMARELAHQLGTPLSSLEGWVEILKLPPGERAELLDESRISEEVRRDVERLERVAHRFELIGRKPELDAVDLGELVKELERYIDARLPRLGPDIELEVRVPPSLPPVRGNAVLLAWAMENVVKNALDALAGRGGTIAIEAREEGPDRVRIAVRDTGPGVAGEIRDRLFESGATTKPGGWGVGLTLARRIVEDVHDGRIELSSEEGAAGTTFVLALPRAEPEGAGEREEGRARRPRVRKAESAV